MTGQEPTHPRARGGPSAGLLALALLGSILMLAGWVLAIVPTFRHVESIALVLAIAVAAFGLVLVPAGLDVFRLPLADAGHGPAVVVASLLPAAALFLATVLTLPIGQVLRAVAVASESLGMGLYGWAWWRYRCGERGGER